MSYQEKRALVSAASTILINMAYAAYMLQRYPQNGSYSSDVFRFWGVFFLILIPVTIVAKIIIHILFSIINTIATKEDEPSVVDERDRIIELKATKNSIYTFGIGFLLAMAALAVDMPPVTMFVVLICTGVVAEIISDLSQFYFYRRGF